MRFAVADEPSVTKLLGVELDGLLGNGFVYHVRDEYYMTVDFPKQTLAFVPKRPHAKPFPLGGYVQISIESYYTIVPTMVNGQGPYRFLLDTGASTCIVARPLAAELGLPEGVSATAKGAVNELAINLSRVSGLAVGAVGRADMDVLLMDCSQVSGYVRGQVDGYLGTDFLQHFALTLDYADEVMAFC